MATPVYGPPVPAPSDIYGSEFDTAMMPGLAQDQTSAAARIAATQDAMNQALTHIAGLQDTSALTPVPAAPSPLLAGLAGFFAHLNAAQTGNGALPSAVMGTLAQAQEYRQRVAAANAESDSQFAKMKLGAQESTYAKYLDLMTQQKIDMNDLQGAYEHQKDLYKLQQQSQKRQADEAQARKDELQAANSARILQRGIALAKMHATVAANSLDQKIAYQQKLVQLGLKPSPAVAAQERQIMADAAAQLAMARTNAMSSMQPLDEDTYNAILTKRDADINALYAANIPTIGPDGKVVPPAARQPVTTPNPKADPLGMNGGKK